MKNIKNRKICVLCQDEKKNKFYAKSTKGIFYNYY